MMFTATATYGANESMMDLLKILRIKERLLRASTSFLSMLLKLIKSESKLLKNDTMGAVSKQLKKAKSRESWATKVKVKGDIRLRYQYQDTDGGNARSRGRYRARIGIHWEACR